jgi:hypothetical protein
VSFGIIDRLGGIRLVQAHRLDAESLTFFPNRGRTHQKRLPDRYGNRIDVAAEAQRRYPKPSDLSRSRDAMARLPGISALTRTHSSGLRA